MITLIFASFMASAQIQGDEPPVNPFRACVQSCHAWYDRPGYQLHKCVSQCERMYLKPMVSTEPEWCETYEEDCERPDNGM